MANIPFVSEEFQRAFRNQFPSQTQTGRDLHVSDIVIPIVDFTPTTAGSSLPETLRTCRDSTITNFIDTTSVNVSNLTAIVTTGFFSVNFILSTEVSASFDVRLVKDGVETIISRIDLRANSSNFTTANTEFVCFNQAGSTLGFTLANGSAGSSSYVISFNQIADVNGNLINPTGYDPQ